MPTACECWFNKNKLDTKIQTSIRHTYLWSDAVESERRVPQIMLFDRAKFFRYSPVPEMVIYIPIMQFPLKFSAKRATYLTYLYILLILFCCDNVEKNFVKNFATLFLFTMENKSYFSTRDHYINILCWYFPFQKCNINISFIISWIVRTNNRTLCNNQFVIRVLSQWSYYHLA